MHPDNPRVSSGSSGEICPTILLVWGCFLEIFVCRDLLSRILGPREVRRGGLVSVGDIFERFERRSDNSG